jgi:hypothetical protein
MGDALNLFDPRRSDWTIPGTSKLTREAQIFLRDLWSRTGGALAPSNNDLAASQFEDAGIEEIRADVFRLRDELGQMPPAVPVVEKIIRVGSVAELRQITPTHKMVAYLEGYYAAGDGGGSALVWMPTSTNADNGGTVFRPDSAPANGRWERGTAEANFRQFGVMSPTPATARARANAAIAFASSLTKRVVRIPADTYTFDDTLSALIGDNWAVLGDGINVSTLKCTADKPIIQIDVSAFNSFFGFIEGVSFEGSNSGADTLSAGIQVVASSSSATGLKYWTVNKCSFTGVRRGMHMQDTGKTSFGGFASITSHGYLTFINNVVTPTLPVEIGFHAEGAFGLHSTFSNNAFRGSAAAMRLGTGEALDSIGDIVITGNHFLSGEIGLDLLGPTTAGAYNQNFVITGNQFDNLMVFTVRASNIKNFDAYPNNSTSSVGISLTSCSDYSIEDRGAMTFQGATRAFEIYAQIVLSDTNGTRIAQDLAFRRSVNTGYMKVVGGNVDGAGAGVSLYGGAHATLANQAFQDASRHRWRSQDGSTAYLDIDGTNVDCNLPARLRSYAKASLPSASASARALIYVSDEVGGATVAFSDGTNWRRVQDYAVVS